jgi:hypothetical protein
MSIQTGTSHGGIPLPDGSVAKVAIDFEAHRAITQLLVTRYGLAGTVQHGASTLPEDLFDLFPKHRCIEIHLATEFQNLIYEGLPQEVRDEMYTWIRANLKDEFKADQTDEQNLYKARKKALGPFKRRLWELEGEAKGRILAKLEAKFDRLFQRLNVVGTRPVVLEHIARRP